ncbi:antibiotic biosynthesis monooxygenase family protein [Flagellimonas sp.]|uniref:antibiotic biosynthesis monooxygenase family protein n=1 Tax=Flagellimonas sp. TaxID=2058762 RepID=UPI003B502F6B
MIIRIFTASVPSTLHQEFEAKFKEISVPLVKGQQGLLGIDIAKPTEWNPNLFVMISKWASKEDLVRFAGEQWNEAHIPKGMEKYIETCSVEHFVNIPI